MSKLTNLNYGVHVIHAVYPADPYRGGAGEAKYPHPPLKSAAASADVFRRAIRLTPADLLADAEFTELARKCAEKGKAFDRKLLAWEKKDVVSAAVAVVRAEVDAERAEAARIEAEQRAAREAKLEAERPTRDAVLTAYHACGYRTCTQGHAEQVEIGARVGASADTFKGSQYSSRCTYRRTTSAHWLYVRPDWLTRVAAVKATVGGELVLDAEACGFLHDSNGKPFPVYELKVVHQAAGTGLDVRTVRAFKLMGAWAKINGRAEKQLTKMPAPVLADYLEDHGTPTADVMPLRAEHVSVS